MLVLQIALSGAGQAAPGGDWIEICGEFGVVEIQLPAAGGGEREDCPKCSICALCAAETGARPAVWQAAGSSCAVDFTVWLPAAVSVRPNPAQYWHDGRGPPLVTKKNSERALRASVAATQSKGGAPWA
ncbi:hypothetical protein [Leisingera sp. ANG-Vp]|uniref:hypothetical protein n=1 Tax=Leisingera sp. ANG-Vp TaxID=1577896 RepID=UPI000A85597B|nr:hypothetical protein [Leisingera sp. ANG-Vp]